MSLDYCSGYAAFIMEDGSVMAFGDMSTEQPTIQNPKIITIPTGERIVDMKKMFYGHYKYMLFLTEGGDLWSYTLHIEEDKLKKIEMPFPIKFIRITHAINGLCHEFVVLDKYRNVYVLQLNRTLYDGSYSNIIKTSGGSVNTIDCGSNLVSSSNGYYNASTTNAVYFTNIASIYYIDNNNGRTTGGFLIKLEKTGNFKFLTSVANSIDCSANNVKECYYSDYFKFSYNIPHSFLENFHYPTIKANANYIYGGTTYSFRIYPYINTCVGYLKTDGKLYVHGFNISNITGEGASEEFVYNHLIKNLTFKNVDLVSYARALSSNSTPTGKGYLYEHCFVGITTDNKIKAWGKDPTGIIIPQSVQDSWGY